MCPYCGASRETLFYCGVHDRLSYAYGSWDYYRCDDCGSCRLDPAPASGDLATFYPPTYGHALPDCSASPLHRWFGWLEHRLVFQPLVERQVRRVLRGTCQTSNTRARVLDLGCGRGERLAAFRRRGWDVVGVDFHAEYAEFAKRRFGVPVICSAIDELYGAIGVVVAHRDTLRDRRCEPSAAGTLNGALLGPPGWIAVRRLRHNPSRFPAHLAGATEPTAGTGK